MKDSLQRSLRYLILVAVGVVYIAGSSFGQRLAIPEGVYYYQPAASVFGPEAIWTNPAGLSHYNAAAFAMMFDLADDKLARSWGTVVCQEQLGFGLRHIYNPQGDDYKEYIYAAGMKLGEDVHLGASYQYYPEAPDELRKDHFWNIGIIGGQGKIRWGAVFSNLNNSRNSAGEKTEAEQRYSLSYRPMGQLVTLSVDMFLSSHMRLSNADYVYHLSLAHKKGLYLTGQIDSDNNFQIGLKANLLQWVAGSHARFNKDGSHRRTTFYLGGTNMRQPSIISPQRRRLSVSISGGVSENPPRPVFGRQRTPFVNLILEIYRAANDRSISEMVLNLRGLSLGFGQAEELRAAIEFLKLRGKRVVCHLSSPNNIGFYVASVCDTILVPPVSRLNLVGLRAELTFLAGTMEKLGIKADIMRIGDYKTAAEQYTEHEATEANREEVNRLLDDLYEQFVTAISLGRSMPVDSVRRLIDRGPYTSQEALESGLIDGLSYSDKLHENWLRPMPEISFRRYQADTLANDGWPRRPELAVVVANGEIAHGSGSIGLFGSSEKLTPSLMNLAFAQATNDPEVRGILMRVNSPGGRALAGEDIYHRAVQTYEKMPMAISMSNMAASGGYQISMPGGPVFANEATITGSIGIFGGKSDLSGLYEKIGLNKELFVRGKHAGMLTTMRPFSDSERQRYFDMMQAFYNHFVDLIAQNRSLSADSVDALAQGRVWTGKRAMQNGLVDHIGGVRQALGRLAEMADLNDYRVVIYPQKRPWLILPVPSALSLLSKTFGWGGSVKTITDGLGVDMMEEGLYTRLPYDISIE